MSSMATLRQTGGNPLRCRGQAVHDKVNTIRANFQDGPGSDATITASTKTVKRMVSKNGKGII